mgnify:FL=1
MKKRMISLALALTLLLSLSAPAFAVDSHFTDVPTSHWAYTQIERAYSDGVIAGTAGNAANYTGVFSPSGTLTEAQFVTIMTRAFFNDELEAAKKVVGSNAKWYAAAQKVAEDKHLLTFVQGKMDAPITRYDMAAIMTNIMDAKEFSGRPGATKIEETFDKIADFKSIPNSYQISVASVFAMGLIAGTDSKGTFSGASYMNRAQAAVVYGRMKDAFLNAGDSTTTTKPDTTEPTPTPSAPGGDGESSVVGTTSSQPVTLSYATHKPVDDYWSKQSETVKNATDKDAFNAAVNTLVHAEEIAKNSSVMRINPYFNYAVYSEEATETSKMRETMAALFSICDNGYKFAAISANGVCVCNAFSMSDKEIAAVAEATNKFTAGMSDKEKIKICVDLITKKFSYDANGKGFSWRSGGTSGVCDHFANATDTILGISGIPVFMVSGNVSNGAHAWNMAYADGEWIIVDATAAEYGYPQYMSMSEHEKLYGYNHSLNNAVKTQIQRALIEAAESARK